MKQDFLLFCLVDQSQLSFILLSYSLKFEKYILLFIKYKNIIRLNYIYL